MYQSLTRVRDADAEPVTLSECKAFAREVGSAEDDVLRALMREARHRLEDNTRRTLATDVAGSGYDGGDGYPGGGVVWQEQHGFYAAQRGGIWLARPPIIELLSIAQLLKDGTITALEPADFEVDTDSGYIWHRTTPDVMPGARATDIRGYQFSYLAGWAGELPYVYRRAICRVVVALFDNRSPAALNEAMLLTATGLTRQGGL